MVLAAERAALKSQRTLPGTCPTVETASSEETVKTERPCSAGGLLQLSPEPLETLQRGNIFRRNLFELRSEALPFPAKSGHVDGRHIQGVGEVGAGLLQTVENFFESFEMGFPVEQAFIL